MSPTVPQAVQSCHELLLWLIPQLDKFPRSRRFTLGERIEIRSSRLLGKALAVQGCKARVMRIASSTVASSSWPNVSILDRNRDLSTDRIWSPNTRAGLPLTTTRGSPGYNESTWLVSGSTTTREPKVLQELFDTITAGLVFLISDPT